MNTTPAAPSATALRVMIGGTEVALYEDPYPGRKGTERVYWECSKCSGSGSVSWGVNVSAVVSGREVPQVCFDCNGTGRDSHLVSSARSSARRRARAAVVAAEKPAAAVVRAAEEAAATAAHVAATRAAFTGANADVVEALPGMPGAFGESLRETFAEAGTLTERQVEAVRRIVAERAAEPEAAPVVVGRGVVTGKIVSRRWQDNPRGYGPGSVKVTVLDDRGFRVYGTLPAAIDDAQRGARVTFTATVVESGRDEAFGYFKRPAQAAVVA